MNSKTYVSDELQNNVPIFHHREVEKNNKKTKCFLVIINTESAKLNDMLSFTFGFQLFIIYLPLKQGRVERRNSHCGLKVYIGYC